MKTPFVIASAFLVFGSAVIDAHAKTAVCRAISDQPYFTDGSRPEERLTTDFDLTIISREAGVLESVLMTTKMSGTSDAKDGLKPLVNHFSAKYLKAWPNQKELLGGWIHATAYMIEGEGCFGSSYRVILPDNLHRLAKGVKFKTEISDQKTPMSCTVVD